MSGKSVGQLGFAEAFLGPGLGSNRTLERIGALVDWGRFERLLSGVRPGETGRPPYPALGMFKALLLQQWYGLSDPGLEEAPPGVADTPPEVIPDDHPEENGEDDSQRAVKTGIVGSRSHLRLEQGSCFFEGFSSTAFQARAWVTFRTDFSVK